MQFAIGETVRNTTQILNISHTAMHAAEAATAVIMAVTTADKNYKSAEYNKFSRLTSAINVEREFYFYMKVMSKLARTFHLCRYSY